MDSIQVFKKERPPISVRDLESELEVLSGLVDEWTTCGRLQQSDKLFQEITTRLHPNLMKALVMIARKQTSSILRNRERVSLTHLGRVRLYGVVKKYFMQWVDVLVTGDGTPFLRRVAISPEGMEFFSITWAGCASIKCADTDRWDCKKKIWLWDSADSEASSLLMRDGVLPYLPLHLSLNETISVFDWHRHLEFSSVATLFHAVDSVGEGHLQEIEKEQVTKLLKTAHADLNPLWSHLARDGEYD